MSKLTVLVTGAGGPAGVAVILSLSRRDDVRVIAADMDGWASGLYLVPPDCRMIVPAGLAPDFVDAVVAHCAAEKVDVLFSTVDVELLPLAARREELKAAGTVLAAPSAETLAICLDKYLLAQHCDPLLRTPHTTLLDDRGVAEPWEFPVIIKPRQGAGSRDVSLIESREELEALPPDPSFIIQEFLPGAEYSVDVIADMESGVIAAVPRSRERVDSGVSVGGRTIRDRALVDTATAAAKAIGLQGVANIQLRRDRDGVPALLEINPRFAGAMPLTIASGVDMPSLLLDMAVGREVPESLDFEEIANVRFLEDVFVPCGEIIRTTSAGDVGGDW